MARQFSDSGAAKSHHYIAEIERQLDSYSNYATDSEVIRANSLEFIRSIATQAYLFGDTLQPGQSNFRNTPFVGIGNAGFTVQPQDLDFVRPDGTTIVGLFTNASGYLASSKVCLPGPGSYILVADSDGTNRYMATANIVRNAILESISNSGNLSYNASDYQNIYLVKALRTALQQLGTNGTRPFNNINSEARQLGINLAPTLQLPTDLNSGINGVYGIRRLGSNNFTWQFLGGAAGGNVIDSDLRATPQFVWFRETVNGWVDSIPTLFNNFPVTSSKIPRDPNTVITVTGTINTPSYGIAIAAFPTATQVVSKLGAGYDTVDSDIQYLNNTLNTTIANLNTERVTRIARDSDINVRINRDSDRQSRDSDRLSRDSDRQSRDSDRLSRDSDRLTREIADRITDVNAEETRALAAELALTNRINADSDRLTREIADRITDVNAEETRALAAELALTNRINADSDRLSQEISDRIADVNAEETRALAAELALTNRINADSDRLTREIADRIADVNAEETRALAAELALTNRGNADSDRLTREISDRIADVNAEETRALAAELALTNRINADSDRLSREISDRITDVNAEETRALAAELALTNRINADSDRLTREISDRITDVNAEETRALAAEAALGTRISNTQLPRRVVNTFTANTNLTYTFNNTQTIISGDYVDVTVNGIMYGSDEYTLALAANNNRITFADATIDDGDFVRITSWYYVNPA